VKGFNRSCIFSAGDETNGDKLWNGSKEDRDVRIEYEEDEGTVCEDGDSDTGWYK